MSTKPIAFVIAVGISILPAHCLCQQTGEPTEPAFDVVSVKPTGAAHLLPPQADGKVFLSIRPFRFSPGGLNANQTLRGLIEEAYSLQDWQIIGPAWINDLTYEVSATTAAGTSRDVMRIMLRTMLAERFGLKFHREVKQMNVGALVAAKRGFRLRELESPGRSQARNSRGVFVGTGDLNTIAEYFRTYSEVPVVNMTGLKGVYHVELHWSPDAATGGRYDPGFWEAAEREAGLKVEVRKMPREVLIVDQADKSPTAN